MMMQVKSVTRMFGGRAAVDRVSFEVPRPAFIGIIGRSGAGKSTLLRLMNRMTDRRIRHLPVLTDGRLAGVVSIGDVVKCQFAEHAQEAESLRTYIAAG